MKKKLFFKRPDWRRRKPQIAASVAAAVLLVGVFLASNQDLWRQASENGAEIDAAGLKTEELSEGFLEFSDASEPAGFIGFGEPAQTEDDSITAAEEEAEEEAVSTVKEDVFFFPPAGGKWDRAFGYGYDETFEDYRFHAGMDMTLPLGELVLAAVAGEVLACSADEQWGGVVLVKSGEIVVEYYGVTPASLNKGEKIEAGEIIGTVAPAPLRESGQKPHLHLEIKLHGEPQDPADYFRL